MMTAPKAVAIRPPRSFGFGNGPDICAYDLCDFVVFFGAMGARRVMRKLPSFDGVRPCAVVASLKRVATFDQRIGIAEEVCNLRLKIWSFVWCTGGAMVQLGDFLVDVGWFMVG